MWPHPHARKTMHGCTVVVCMNTAPPRDMCSAQGGWSLPCCGGGDLVYSHNQCDKPPARYILSLTAWTWHVPTWSYSLSPSIMKLYYASKSQKKTNESMVQHPSHERLGFQKKRIKKDAVEAHRRSLVAYTQMHDLPACDMCLYVREPAKMGKKNLDRQQTPLLNLGRNLC